MAFVIPQNAKVVIGIGAAFIGALTAYQASNEGLELAEDTINTFNDKVSSKIKHKNDSAPAAVEQ